MHVWDHLQLEITIKDNYSSFRQIVLKAEEFLQQRRYEAAAVYAQIAAHHAWFNHNGLFTSPRLEQILLELGRNIVRPLNLPRDSNPRSQLPARVMHVLTQAYQVGGHTRLVSRWIEQDGEREHSLVLTRQGYQPVPQFLRDAVSRSGGRIFLLDEKGGRLLSRASKLRQLAQSAEQIVLHVHPYDVVPVMAFAERQRSLIFTNHADHVFWIGTSVADVVAHIREGSLDLSHRRRGIDPARCFVLPIPLPSVPQTPYSAGSKQRLGISPENIVLLSVGNPYKFRAKTRPSFVEAHLPVLEEFKNTVLLAVGPDEDDITSDQSWRKNERPGQGFSHHGRSIPVLQVGGYICGLDPNRVTYFNARSSMLRSPGCPVSFLCGCNAHS